MAKPQIIILSLLLPFCFGQFSIQGPSDGNRRAQGLKYSADKGIEYTDQAESQGTGGFSITGASDGNTNFQIQGATDGNSEFRIQGATDGNSQFQIHGPTDGGSQAYLHNYNPEQDDPQQIVNNQGRAIQYKDPSGQRVNWRSYNRAAEEPAPRPAQRRPAHRRTQARPQPQPQAQPQPEPRYQQAPVANINYNPIEKAPPSIQEILQFQAQIPYVNIIPEHLRVDTLSAAQEQAKKFAEDYPKQVLANQPPVVIEEAPRSQYRSKPRPREQTRERRQAPEYQQSYQQPEQDEAYAQYQQAYARQVYAQQQQQQQRRQAPQYSAYQQQQQQQAYLQQEQEQPQQQQYSAAPSPKAYRRVVQPPADPAPQYSSNVPQQIQEILKYQAQIPYDIIANQISFKLDKPYVPQPVQRQQEQEAAPVPAQYKPQPEAYPPQYDQGQAAAYAQQQQQQPQGRLGYAQTQGLGYYGNQQYDGQQAERQERQY